MRPIDRRPGVAVFLIEIGKVEHVVIGLLRALELGEQQFLGRRAVTRLVEQLRRVGHHRLAGHRVLGIVVRPGDAPPHFVEHGGGHFALRLGELDLGERRIEPVANRQAAIGIDFVERGDQRLAERVALSGVGQRRNQLRAEHQLLPVGDDLLRAGEQRREDALELGLLRGTERDFAVAALARGYLQRKQAEAALLRRIGRGFRQPPEQSARLRRVFEVLGIVAPIEPREDLPVVLRQLGRVGLGALQHVVDRIGSPGRDFEQVGELRRGRRARQAGDLAAVGAQHDHRGIAADPEAVAPLLRTLRIAVEIDRDEILRLGDERRVLEQGRLHLVARRAPHRAPVEDHRLVAFLRFGQCIVHVALSPVDLLPGGSDRRGVGRLLAASES